ncbi:hypothetical protein OWV82_004966 [Melia azedarach]|uniref:Uncharacterized protein n=1 Tax=Melia azedarach TaxID=155640 RepID=A0ACC1YS89_MELAZ|nr:hypothetical protein OWV82_004966 [Melia azedarach]
MSITGGRVCKYEMAFKTTQQNRNGSAAESVVYDNNSVWRISGGVNSNSNNNQDTNRIHVGDEKRKRRQEEKAEMLWHLICWGPNM